MEACLREGDSDTALQQAQALIEVLTSLRDGLRTWAAEERAVPVEATATTLSDDDREARLDKLEGLLREFSPDAPEFAEGLVAAGVVPSAYAERLVRHCAHFEFDDALACLQELRRGRD